MSFQTHFTVSIEITRITGKLREVRHLPSLRIFSSLVQQVLNLGTKMAALSALDLQASRQSAFQGLKEVQQSKVHRSWRRREGAGAWSLVELWWGPTIPSAHWFLPEEHPVPLQLGSVSSHIL